MLDSVILYDANNNPMAVANGAAAPVSAQMLGLYDGTNLQFAKGDSYGYQHVSWVPNSLSQTYSVAVTGLAAITGATDILTLQGSNTKTIYILEIRFSGTIGTAGIRDCRLGWHTVDNAGAATDISASILKHRSSNNAPTAVVKTYTANPTTINGSDAAGSNVSYFRSDKYAFLGTSSTPTSNPQPLVWNWARSGQPIILTTNSQWIALNLNGATLASTVSIDIAIEWVEE